MPEDWTYDVAAASGLGLKSLNLDTEYRTGEGDMARDFFEPCIRRAERYDRAVGYFRSSVFLVLGDDVLGFVRRGGKIRFVCSPELAEDDLAALEEGYAQREQIIEHLLEREINELLREERTRG